VAGRVAAFATRRAVAFAQWRARREVQAELARPRDQVFRGVIQINLIRSR
jgi:hypothetical protein